MEIRKDAFEIMLQMVVRLSESFTKAYWILNVDELSELSMDLQIRRPHRGNFSLDSSESTIGKILNK